MKTSIAEEYAELTGRRSWGEALDRLVPYHMQPSIVRWIADGDRDRLGHFLTALLSNDLMGAFGRADDINVKAMHDWATFLHNYAPSGCYGSPEAVKNWEGLREKA